MVSVLLEPNSAFMDAESDGASDELSKIQASFVIARPPPKSSLWLTPKLLLQFQQLTTKHRPRPVMGIWQLSIRKSKLTRDFHQHPKLRFGDSYATYDEPYTISSHNLSKQPGESTKQHDKHAALHNKDPVAVMCHSTCDKARASTLSFRNEQCTWRVSTHSGSHAKSEMRYRFTIKDEHSSGGLSRSMSMQWEKRFSDDGDSALVEGECKWGYFALCFIDHEARRKSRIATMTPTRLDIRVRKSSIIEHLQTCMDLTGLPVNSCEYSESLEAQLYTHVLTMGAWVTDREGWLNHP
ncbi:hypothetical protein ABHI18_005164 [Aspergillus niger]